MSAKRKLTPLEFAEAMGVRFAPEHRPLAERILNAPPGSRTSVALRVRHGRTDFMRRLREALRLQGVRLLDEELH